MKSSCVILLARAESSPERVRISLTAARMVDASASAGSGLILEMSEEVAEDDDEEEEEEADDEDEDDDCEEDDDDEDDEDDDEEAVEEEVRLLSEQ